MSAKKTPEQIVAELRADPLRWMNDWSEADEAEDDPDEPVIGLDGAYTLDELRAIVAVREKQLGLPDPIQDAARKCAKIVRNACMFEDWQREFGITKGASSE